MKKTNVLNNKTMRQFLLAACVAVLVLTFVVARPLAARAGDTITVPAVPDGLQVTAEEGKVFLVGHATGTQNYICLPAGTGFAFSLFTPQATLVDEDNEKIISHFFAPNPGENRTIRATWEYKDQSTIFAATVPNGASSDSRFVEAGAVAWLKLEVKNHLDGPTGGVKLSRTTFVQRLNTHGGLAPATGCASSTDVGTRAFMPYTADYFFYRK